MRDNYTELTVEVREPFVELVADRIAGLIDEGVEMGSGRIIVRTEQSIEPILNALDELDPAIGVRTHVEIKENIDWIRAYQESITPIEAGRFYVHPEWYPPKADAINILINPALAFGSGHHATTHMCLEAIGKRVGPDQRLLDVGCGSGILALAASKLGARVELCDVDPQAVESARSNFRLNNADYEAIWEGSIHQAQGSYDVIVANIIADVLRALAPQLTAGLTPKGTLILSGILDTKESIVTRAFDRLHLIERTQKDEWVTLTYTKG
jgi:ribosomal protein L11 methyltransferase